MIKGNPLVSIIVPVYGVEAYLDQCINSIVEQTYQNIELILIDDGSSDRCPEICDAWATRDCRIQVLHIENGGQSSARNIGLDTAKGEWIFFVDSDDWIEPECISVLVEISLVNNADISVIYPQNHKGNTVIPKSFFLKDKGDMYCLSAEDAVTYFMEQAVAVMGKLYRADILQDIRFPVGRKAEEYIVQLAALKKAKIIAFCNRNLYDYLVRNDSDSHDIKPKYRVDNIQAISEALDICRRDFRCEEEWAFRWLCALLHEFYSVSEFAKEEKKKYNDILVYALSQVGGMEQIYKKMEQPLDRIIYVANQYQKILKEEEYKILQKQYREVYRSQAKREVKGIKYRIANLNLKFLVALYNGREVIK